MQTRNRISFPFPFTIPSQISKSSSQSQVLHHSSFNKMEDPNYNVIPKPADWFTTLISLQADLLYNCFVTLSSPFLAVLSLASETTASVETAVQKVPSNITHGSAMVLKRLGLGLLGAAQVCMVLVLVMGLAALVGIGLVQLWLEEPVVVRDKLFFDYTEVNPKAVFGLSGGTGFDFDGKSYMKRLINVPVGHTFHLHLLLLMPESEFNRHIGVFQLTAELLSTTGNVIAKSSQPVMLQFRSLPVRLARTFVMGIPLLLGISSETQKLKVEILRYKEGHPRSGSVRVTLAPRAGTSSLPQLYEAEIIINSQLPWTKQLVHNWKWTLYVWTSLYVYIIFLILVITCFRPLFFPVTTTAGFNNRDQRERDHINANAAVDASEEALISGIEDQNRVSGLISKWQHSRRKRKAVFLDKDFSDIAAGGSSASSMSVTREDTSASAVIEDDVGDSESVCLGG